MARRDTRIDKLIEDWEPRLRDAFLESVATLKDRAQISQIIRALEVGDVERAIRAMGLDSTAFRVLDQALTAAFEAGGNATMSGLPIVRDVEGMRVQFNFDIRNPEAERWLSERAGTQIVQVVDDQVQMTREVLRAGLARGDNPRTVALDLVGRIGPDGRRQGGFIGLTSSQSEWVRNYGEELRSDSPSQALSRNLRDRRFDKTVLKYEASGEPIPEDLIEKMIMSYENRALRFRAEGIARSEAMAALHESQEQAMEQAVETGAIREDDVTYIWHATNDNRTREIHADMDGQEVRMGEKFIDGAGNELEYPGDPNAPAETRINCRCWREPNVDFLADID